MIDDLKKLYLRFNYTDETLPFSQLMYERLKHTYLDKEEAKRLQS